jgi:Bacterial lipid A biosynthesis acyltransferase
LVEQRITNARVGSSILFSGTNSAPAARPTWWVRAVAAIPLGALYWLANLLAFLADRVFPYRRHVVLENLTIAFPDSDAARMRVVIREYYRGFADMLIEIVKSAGISRTEITRRVVIRNLDLLQAELARGKPVLCVAAHQCNWEWMLLSLSAQLDVPLDAAYKPLIDSFAEREMRTLRSQFGARMVPAQDERAQTLGAISESRYGVFLGRRGDRAHDSLCCAVHSAAPHGAGLLRDGIRAARGGGRKASRRRIHRALRAPGRGADPRRAGGLAVVAQALEAEEISLRGLISSSR